MSQEQINFILAITSLLGVFSPILTRFLDKLFSKGKDKLDYSGDMLDLLNRTTDALKQAREDLRKSEAEYEKTVEAMRTSHDASLDALRQELSARINRQKARIEDLENVKRVYTIQFDLVTHPNIEVMNVKARAMDDVSASQKVQAINKEQLQESKEKK